MLFIHPTWDNESERIGKKKCTPLGYALHTVADLLGFLGLLLLFGTAVFLGYRGSAGSFNTSLLWLFVFPFFLGLVGRMLFQFSWFLARRSGFEYDPETSEASWYKDGNRVTYRFGTEDAKKTDGSAEE
jgi:hypothetical protein